MPISVRGTAAVLVSLAGLLCKATLCVLVGTRPRETSFLWNRNLDGREQTMHYSILYNSAVSPSPTYALVPCT